MNTRFFILFIALSLISELSFAQNQDCNTAIQVCTVNVVQNTTTLGFGTVQELNYPINTSCLAANEQNSTWYTFTASASGSLEFQISPTSVYADYDWAIFDITNVGCPGIINGSAPQIICNYSVFPGITGTDAAATGNSAGPLDPNLSAPVNLISNHTYAMVVNDANGSTSSYDLNFSGSATIIDNTTAIPIDIAHFDCDQRDSIIVTLNEFVQCNSISADGSDFNFTGPSDVFIYSAKGVNCGVAAVTNQIVIYFSPTINKNGIYQFQITTGNDGNTLLDICGNQTSDPTSFSYTVTNIPEVYLGNDTSICDGDIYTLDAGNPGLSYYWSTGQNSQIASFSEVPQTIIVRVDRLGCYALDTIEIASACAIYVPNVFSPNGDGHNDVFNFISAELLDYEMSVYDRWGTRVFYTNRKGESWDGRTTWGETFDIGTYAYLIQGHYRNGRTFSKTGNVTLLK